MLIEGIKILNVGEEAISYGWSWNPLGTAGIIIGVILLILALWGSCATGEDSLFIIFAAIGVGAIACGIIYNKYQNPVKITTYEVTIDDNVSINELTEKYDIIEQRGRIYKITEKQE